MNTGPGLLQEHQTITTMAYRFTLSCIVRCKHSQRENSNAKLLVLRALRLDTQIVQLRRKQGFGERYPESRSGSPHFIYNDSKNAYFTKRKRNRYVASTRRWRSLGFPEDMPKGPPSPYGELPTHPHRRINTTKGWQTTRQQQQHQNNQPTPQEDFFYTAPPTGAGRRKKKEGMR